MGVARGEVGERSRDAPLPRLQESLRVLASLPLPPILPLLTTRNGTVYWKEGELECDFFFHVEVKLLGNLGKIEGRRRRG